MSKYNAKVYREQKGKKLVVASGGELEALSGGTIDVQSGVTETHANNPTFSGNPSFTGAPVFADGYVLPDSIGLLVRASVALVEGDLVYISSWNETDGVFVVAKADADLSGGGQRAQYIARAAISQNATGRVYKTHRLTALDTSGGSEGDPVYLSTTAAGWTLTAPTGADDAVQVVGHVAVSSMTVGVIEFNLLDLNLRKIAQNELQAASISGAKLVATFMDIYLADGQDETMDTTIPVTGLAAGDRVLAAFVLTTKASIATLAKRAATDFTVTGTDEITVGANAADNTNNQYMFFILKA